jgi:transposase InsO family protein
VSSVFELVEREERGPYPIIKMCAWVGVSRSGYYDWRRRGPSVTEQHRNKYRELVKAVFVEFDSRYGYRKIARVLWRRGHVVSEYLVRDIMTSENLECCHPRPYLVTTLSDGSDGIEDYLEGDFSAFAPGDRFVGDITYVKTWAGWLYLATVIDLFNREVVGYAMASHMRTELVVDAVQHAINKGKINEGAIFHSDRGSQYTSTEFGDFLDANDMTGSMGRTGVCWDNAVAESFFATLKKELVHRCVFPTRKHAVRGISAYIDGFYNPIRLHSKLGYTSPLEARESWEARQEAA